MEENKQTALQAEEIVKKADASPWTILPARKFYTRN